MLRRMHEQTKQNYHYRSCYSSVSVMPPENANDYSLLGALREMVEQLSQHGVKDTDVDMDLLLEYVEAADGCDYCRAGDGKPSVDELTTKINQQLARRGQAQVEASDQSVLKFEPLVHLVTAGVCQGMKMV